MTELLKQLCAINAPSGNEKDIRDFIISQLEGYAELSLDAMGNLIAKKTNGAEPVKNIMVDAHMDEVGLIVTSATPDGFLKFKPVGGVEPEVMAAALVDICGVKGTVVSKPIHFLSEAERKSVIDKNSLCIDIGAKSRDEAQKIVPIGSTGVFCGGFCRLGNFVKAKALDDRIGVAVLIKMLKNNSLPRFTGVFSVQEEVGARGAATAAFSLKPDGAVVLEATTAADILDVPEDKKVCVLGQGPAVSFMDGGTVYDRKLYDYAFACGVKCQVKKAVTGGNNSGNIQRSAGGVPVIAVSVPCRYIHSPACVSSPEDIACAEQLAEKLVAGMALGEIV